MSDRKPLLRPTYRVGDRLVIYLSREGRRACPAIVRVTQLPVFDPDRVRREARPGDEQHWAWVTGVTGVTGEHSIELQDAPTLAHLGIAPSSVRQKSHIRLTFAQFQRALRAMR